MFTTNLKPNFFPSTCVKVLKNDGFSGQVFTTLIANKSQCESHQIVTNFHSMDWHGFSIAVLWSVKFDSIIENDSNKMNIVLPQWNDN